MPSVNRAYDALKDKGLEVLLVDFREDPGQVAKVVRERGYTMPVVLDQSGDVTGKTYGVWGPPTFFFIDRRGQLVGHAIGARGWDSPKGRVFLEALLAD